jgi:hypothetical protein
MLSQTVGACNKHIGQGYSGAEPCGKNDPRMQGIPDVGPIPRGFYTIGIPYDSRDHGPHVMRLLPDAENTMFGRSEFLMHGDSLERPGQASKGCIIMPPAVREFVSASGDIRLQVTE